MEEYPVFRPQSFSVKTYLFLKRLFYYVSKFIGLFLLAGFVTRKGLRIINYHGFCLNDECSFSPRTFISPDKFRKRIQFIKGKGFPILGLDEALECLEMGELPDRAIVITIDDGFYSTYRCAYPILKEYTIPATLYVTTYYAMKGNPIFNLVVSYMLWKTKKSVITLDGLGIPIAGKIRVDKNLERERVAQAVIDYGESRCGEKERCQLVKEIGERLGIDYESIAEDRILSIMNMEEIRELSDSVFDIELHSHRHRFPNNKEEALKEIMENKSVLEPLVGRELKHFCYPSGIWVKNQWPWLSEAEIRSAVTTERGLNFRGSPKYALKRFGDDELLSQIEFEAEIHGYAELMRIIQSNFTAVAKRILGKTATE